MEPVFDKNSISIVFALDENYIKYLVVVLQSLIVNSSKDNNYDIIILETGISIEKQNVIKKIGENYKNISIRFFDVEYIFKKYDENIFYTFLKHTSKATYYRFFLPQVCENYDKILYLDCDIVINDDIAKLYNKNIGNNLVGAVIEHISMSEYRSNREYENYYKNILKVENMSQYFNAGVMIFNIFEMKKMNFTEKCIEKLIEVKEPPVGDQDILNAICQNRTFFIETNWNYCWHGYILCLEKMRQYLTDKEYQSYINARNNPYIIHYTSAIKPWNDSKKDSLAEFWWKYAFQTPFFKIEKNS